jgi:hypothetical protein
MTAQLLYSMTCDGVGCSATFTIGSRFATPMRSEAARSGWSWRAQKVSRSGPAKSIDLCPKCEAERIRVEDRNRIDEAKQAAGYPPES